MSGKLIGRFRQEGLLESIDAGGSVGTAWASPDGISSLMKHLASGFETRLSHQVRSASRAGSSDLMKLQGTGAPDGDFSLTARHIVITVPMPQAVEMAPDLADAAGGGAEGVIAKALVGLFRFADGSPVTDT